MISEAELEQLMQYPTGATRSNPLWLKAFDEYNSDNPRRLSRNCGACYFKVLIYLKKKYNK